MWIHKAAVLRRAVSCIGAAAFFTEVQAQAPNRVVELVARQTTTVPAPAGSIIPPPVLNFVDEESYKPVVCQPVTIEWFYNGPAETITLLATNVGVSQSTLPAAMGASANRAATPLITVQIAKVNPYLDSYTWSKVNVPSGMYILNATMDSPTFVASSNVIFVQSGSDNSCLSSNSTSTSSPSPSSPTTPNTSASASATTSANPVLVPVGSSSSSNSTMIGAIVGSCLGAVALAALMFLICIFYRKRRFTKANGTGAGFSFASGKTAGKGFGSYPGEHRFNGLGSFDSRNALGGRESTRSSAAGGVAGRHRHHTSSFGTSVMMNGSEEGIGMGAEKGSLHSSKSNPNIHSDPFGNGDESVALASLPVLTGGPAYGPSPSPNPTGFSVSARESMDSTTYPPTSPITTFRNSAHLGGFGGLGGSPGLTPSHSISASNASHPQDSVPQTPVDATANSPITGTNNNSTNAAPLNKKANRQSFGKKRKPVPAYDASSDPISPSDLSRSGSQSYAHSHSHSQSQSPPPHSQSSHIAYSPPTPSPFSPSPSPIPTSTHGHGQSQEMYMTSASPSSSNLGHYSTRNRSAQDLNLNTSLTKPELARKSSFGNSLGSGMGMDAQSKPMHYLIPDMPMPQNR